MPSGYTILDHPADLGLEATGPTLAAAFANAGLALMSVIVDPANVRPVDHLPVVIEADDPEQLLVRWLDELLFRYDGSGFITREIDVQTISPHRLEATISGECLDVKRHTTRVDVKAVTYHQIVVREDGDGGYIRVYLDI
jgi:SHS2 domain-containing protein